LAALNRAKEVETMDLQVPTTRRRFLMTAIAAGTLSGLDSRVTAASRQRDSYRVFSEGRIADLRLKNRLVRSATAENACRESEMTEEGINLYRGLAAGGVGLIITGYMGVMPEGRSNDLQTVIYDDRFIDSLHRIAGVVHETDKECKVVAQLAHVGMQTQATEPVGPTATAWPHVEAKPRALTTKEVEGIVASFAQAARRAKGAGFDGVQLHAAHGYLLSSFLSPYTNTRTDKYGGSLAKRVRIIREIVDQSRALVGPDLPILIKMNCDDLVKGGTDIHSFPQLAKEIGRAGIQAVEVSGNNPIREKISSPEEQSYFLSYAQKLRLNVPVILTGGNRSVERLEQISKAGTPQFFGFARPLLREPNMPARWLEGRGAPEAACISCNRCIRGFAKGKITRCRISEVKL
jgi:2,4-dienoyl-CoA reductase-like NADH-dependent reductase (Old Yellow Enzyme family)